MRKYVIMLALMAVTMMASAQKNAENSKFVIDYNATFTVGADEGLKDDEMILIIGDNTSMFLSKRAERDQFVKDSIMEAGGSPMDFIAAKQKMPHKTLQNYAVFKNIPEGKLTYTTEMGKSLKYEEKMPEIAWKYEDGDTIIAEYPCQKATTDFMGRHWTVWYTMEIPVSDGPWKLNGLPGLIMAACESDGYFSFECSGVTNLTTRKIEIPKKNYMKVTPKKLQEMVAMSKNDIKGFISQIAGIIIDELKDQNGNEVKEEHHKIVFIDVID